MGMHRPKQINCFEEIDTRTPAACTEGLEESFIEVENSICVLCNYFLHGKTGPYWTPMLSLVIRSSSGVFHR